MHLRDALYIYKQFMWNVEQFVGAPVGIKLIVKCPHTRCIMKVAGCGALCVMVLGPAPAVWKYVVVVVARLHERI